MRIPSTAKRGNLIDTNPGFINAAAGNFRLRETAPISSAINAGLTPVQAAQLNITFPSQDLDGPAGQRVVGLRADIGAYESPINDASVLIVSSIGDSGVGTLRQALISANANPGKQVVEFNLPGACHPISRLPRWQSRGQFDHPRCDPARRYGQSRTGELEFPDQWQRRTGVPHRHRHQREHG